jgi:uncharacterized protein (DUF58 family)
MKNWIRRQFRKKSRVYIFPTKMGGYLNGLIFLMFLLAIGYSNNLLLIFTVFLLGFNLIWLIQGHMHLHRLRLDQVTISPGHAGEPVPVNIMWKSQPSQPRAWMIKLESLIGEFTWESFHEDDNKSEGQIIPNKRGLHFWDYLQVKSTNPFGLYQVWIFFPLKMESLVYPGLMKSAEIPLTGIDLEGDILVDKKGAEDFRGLSSYQNDESRKISWKHYARTGQLVVKEGEDQKSATLELELKIPNDPAMKETYLSRLATQMVECHRREIPFSLTGEGIRLYSGTGPTHLHECLKVLALC